jgi:hypothetical protein
MTTLPTSKATTAELIERYAAKFNETTVSSHGVSSALGLWLLLALIAPDASADALSEIEYVLGTTADDAAKRARQLLEKPHPALASAVALWYRDEFLNNRFFTFSTSLPSLVERGPMPTQDHADEWAATNTKDLIKSFPISIDETTAVILASALATKGQWMTMFEDVGPKELAGEFSKLTDTALRAPWSHVQAIIKTTSAGLVGVHAATTTDGLLIVSVIGSPIATPAQLHGAAAEVGRLLTNQATEATTISLYDLDLGPGIAWDIIEREYEDTGGNKEKFNTIMAPWAMTSKHELLESPGVAAALSTMYTWLKEEWREGATFEAIQSTMAKFAKEGFEAAAVTAMGMFTRSAAMPSVSLIREREITIRFNRPYAVLALTIDKMPSQEKPWEKHIIAGEQWSGLNVFSAWVGRPG